MSFNEPLRKCIKCGIEAYTISDLENFAKSGIGSHNKYNRRNICKKCYAEKERNYRKERFELVGLCRNCGKPNDRAEKGPYCINCCEKFRKLSKQRHDQLRIKVIDMFGRKCIRCGIEDTRLLTINHKEGRKLRRTKDQGDKFYYDILNGKRSKHDLEIRCYNCQVLFEYEQGYRKDLISSSSERGSYSQYGVQLS